MMARYNQAEVVRSLYAYRHQLDQVIEQIEQKNWTGLESLLEKTGGDRPTFLSP